MCPSRFEAALWCGEDLCALAIGGPCHNSCRIDYLEGSPDLTHPRSGQVWKAVSATAEWYAKRLQREEVRIMEPRLLVGSLFTTFTELRYELITPERRIERPYLRLILRP